MCSRWAHFVGSRVLVLFGSLAPLGSQEGLCRLLRARPRRLWDVARGIAGVGRGGSGGGRGLLSHRTSCGHRCAVNCPSSRFQYEVNELNIDDNHLPGPEFLHVRQMPLLRSPAVRFFRPVVELPPLSSLALCIVGKGFVCARTNLERGTLSICLI